MNRSRKLFGTDGIRGKVGVFPITSDACHKIANLMGQRFERTESNLVLIGKDTRASCDALESALQDGFNSAGIDVGLLGIVPTPAVAYLTRSFGARLGVVVSASHNPHTDNGIKIFSGGGSKLSVEEEAMIEQNFDSELVAIDSEFLGVTSVTANVAQRYIEFCKRTIAEEGLQGLCVVLDCAHGATYSVAPRIFAELGADTQVIGAEPNGLNINAGVGSTNPRRLQDEVVKRRADVGFAFDGDGDRVVMVDERGNLLDGDYLLYALAKSRLAKEEHVRGVVGTVMSNLGLENALGTQGIAFVRTDVGDRNVSETMTRLGWQLGGEPSGHIFCHDASPTGDGIITALQVLRSCIQNACTISELVSDMKKFPQKLVNVSSSNPIKLGESPLLSRLIDEFESKKRPNYRIMVRPSGTEPVLRVMVEGENTKVVEEETNRIADQLHSGDLDA